MPDRRPGGVRSTSEPPATDPELAAVRDPGSGADDPFDPLTSTSQLAAVDVDPDTDAGPSTPPPRRTTLHPGVRLDGRYQLQFHISDRAEVQLWQGEDQVLARPVAIRVVVDDGQPGSVENIRRLLDGARRSGQLVHTGAASTYDATTTDADGLPLAYVVSEWVHGVSLLNLLRDAPLLPDRAATIIGSVARVIAAAHAVGVTHGDLHPGDVIVTSHGLVKVLDLEMRGELQQRSAAERRARDVVGLGALLYASLTGRWPLGAGRGLPPAELDPSGACRSPRQLRAGVPRELDALTMAALSTGDGPAPSDPAHPPPTALEFADALETIGGGLQAGAAPVPDDGPEADTPAVQSAKAAQAEALARASALRSRSWRRRILPIILLVVLALAAWLIGVAVGKLPSAKNDNPTVGGDSAAKPTGAALKLASVSDFDPLGDTVEDPTAVPLAHDGNPDTAWATETYFRPNFGGNVNKTGVGLKVDLGRAVTVSQVRLLFKEAGVAVELRYSDSDSASQESYTVAARSGDNPPAQQTLVPRTGAHRYWLIWLTSLPQVNTPTGTGYQADLAEMTFYG